MQIRVKKLSSCAKLPTKASVGAAGYDLYACLGEAVSIPVGESVMIPTGLSIEIPAGYAGLIYARSGIATNKGLAPANKVGVCDSDYRGEYKIVLHNHSKFPAMVLPGERIAQLVITPCIEATFIEAISLSDTQRGEKGFGSTGC